MRRKRNQSATEQRTDIQEKTKPAKSQAMNPKGEGHQKTEQSQSLPRNSVRMGELTKAIPKSAGGRPAETTDTAVASFKPKSEVVRDLGFSAKQVERFEALASNKDLVEQEKAFCSLGKFFLKSLFIFCECSEGLRVFESRTTIPQGCVAKNSECFRKYIDIQY